MDLSNLSELLRREASCGANERWPEPTMNESDLAVDEATDENVISTANRPRDLEDLVALRMRPPTPPNGLARDRDGQ